MVIRVISQFVPFVFKFLFMSLKERVIELLINILKNGNEPARGYAAIALGALKAQPAVEPLIERLANDDDPDIRGEAALSLGKILSPNPNHESRITSRINAVNALTASLKDNDAIVRLDSAAALGMIKDSNTVEPLIETLKSEDFLTYPFGNELAWNYQEDVRHKAIESLGEIGDVRAVEPLISIINNGYNGNIGVIFDTLSKIKDDRAVAFLMEKIKDDNPAIRRIAARALENIADNQAVMELLINSLLDKNNSVKITSAKALSRLSGKMMGRIMVPLTLLLGDRDKEVRKEVARIVAKIENDTVIEHITSLLNDDDAEVRMTAAELLGDIGNEKAVNALIGQLDDDDEVVMEVISSLKKLKAQDAAENLLSIIKDKERTKGVRISAAQAVACLMEKDDIKKYLGNIDEEIKAYIIRNNENKEIKKTADSLIADLKDDDPAVRREAVISLGSTGDNRAIEPLISALFDPERFIDIRSDIAKSLKKACSERSESISIVINRLIDVLNDTNLSHYHWLAAEAVGIIANGNTNFTNI